MVARAKEPVSVLVKDPGWGRVSAAAWGVVCIGPARVLRIPASFAR